jgi:hypothetical protein
MPGFFIKLYAFFIYTPQYIYYTFTNQKLKPTNSMENPNVETGVVLSDLTDLPVLPDNDKYKNRVQIKSESSDRLYIVSQTKATNLLQCSCFGYIRHRHCKHLDALRPLYNQLEKLA